MISATHRPFTATVTESAIACTLCASPIHVGEHMIHAWDALAAASREPAKRAANVAYAAKRTDDAEAMARRTLAKKPRKLAQAMTEVAKLREEIRLA